MPHIHPARAPRRTLAVFFAGLGLALAATAGETVRISGTGSGVGGMQLLADAYMSTHPGVKVDVLPALGSGGGISALIPLIEFGKNKASNCAALMSQAKADAGIK